MWEGELHDGSTELLDPRWVRNNFVSGQGLSLLQLCDDKRGVFHYVPEGAPGDESEELSVTSITSLPVQHRQGGLSTCTIYGLAEAMSRFGDQDGAEKVITLLPDVAQAAMLGRSPDALKKLTPSISWLWNWLLVQLRLLLKTTYHIEPRRTLDSSSIESVIAHVRTLSNDRMVSCIC